MGRVDIAVVAIAYSLVVTLHRKYLLPYVPMLLFHETADITRSRPVRQRPLTKALLGEPLQVQEIKFYAFNCSLSTMRRRPLFYCLRYLKDNKNGEC